MLRVGPPAPGSGCCLLESVLPLIHSPCGCSTASKCRNKNMLHLLARLLSSQPVGPLTSMELKGPGGHAHLLGIHTLSLCPFLILWFLGYQDFLLQTSKFGSRGCDIMSMTKYIFPRCIWSSHTAPENTAESERWNGCLLSC